MRQFDSCEQVINMLLDSVCLGIFTEEKAYLEGDRIEIGGYYLRLNPGTEILVDKDSPGYIFCITEDLGDGTFLLAADIYRMIVDQNPGVILPMKYRQIIIDIIRSGNY